MLMHMGGCHWKVTRMSAGYDRFNKARYAYVLGDVDSYPGRNQKSWPTEELFFNEAQVLSALAESMGASWDIAEMLRLWDESPEFREIVEHAIHRDLWVHNQRGCIHDPKWRPIMEKEDEDEANKKGNATL